MDLRKILFFFLIPLTLSAQQVDYVFEGQLQVKPSTVMQNYTKVSGAPINLEDVDVRVVRRKGSKLRGKSPDAQTDKNGRFFIKKKFDRDRNGRLPGKKDIRFQVDIRFRNDDVKIKKGGWGKVNWFTVATFNDRANDGDGAGKDLGNMVFNQDTEEQLKDDLASKHAELYWIHMKVVDTLASHRVGLSNKITVTYPHKNIFKGKDKGFAMRNSFLGNDDFPGDPDGLRTIMHEIVHVWHMQNMRGNASVKCLFDGHHKDPDKLFPSICSGFTEGLAAAAGQKLAHDIFGRHDPSPYPMWRLRQAMADKPYQIKDLNDAQRSDLGWENFFLFITERGSVWDIFSEANASCDPQDASVYQLLNFIDDSDIRPGRMTFAKFAGLLESDLGMSSRDAAIYEKLGNPANTADQIISEECSSTKASLLREALPASPSFFTPDAYVDFTGRWDTDFGELRLHQIKDYVIGDYADKGVILAKIEGNCLRGVFTNDERNGIISFSLKSDDTFEGSWGWHGEEADNIWKGRRTSENVNTLTNLGRNNDKIRTKNDDRDVYDGIYNSQQGILKLMSRDMFLIGDYAEKGIIAGMWNGSGFEGIFTNGEDTGRFNWIFFSKSGKFREGSWTWIGKNGGGSWSMEKESNRLPKINNMTNEVSCR